MAISWLCHGHIMIIMVVFLLAIPWLDHHWFIDVYDSIATGEFLALGNIMPNKRHVEPCVAGARRDHGAPRLRCAVLFLIKMAHLV